MTTTIHRRVEAAQRGDNPAVISKMPSGWAVMSDVQVLRGYCLLLPDPVVPDLNAMDLETRTRFLRDMSILGDAVLEVTRAARINYEILGNQDPALHAHVIPRFRDEPETVRTKPIWFYDWAGAPQLDPRADRELMEALRAALQKRIEV